ncbi:MFS transporter [Kouleothrix sp.]|uniref:MFS transporter n=1 Tax=Kouleothrix sp. TaxID=2779161 RepID=UPI00391D3715
MNSTFLPSSVARRLVAVLFFAQCLSSAALIANIQVNPIVGSRLGGSDSLAGVPGTLLLIGAAVSAHVSGRFMQRFGRRPGLALGFVVGTCGMLLSGAGVVLGSFGVFLVGVALMGAARGAADQSRYAAADTQPPEHRARAISTVVFAGTVGAIAGPWLASSRGNLLGGLTGVPQAGPMWAGALLFAIAGVLVFVLLRPDPLAAGWAGQPHQPHAPAERGRTLGALLRLPAAQLALASMVVGQATMVLVMSVTSLHMDHNHHGGDEISLVFMAHTIGMYGLSIVNGGLIDRLGRRAAIAIGVGLLVAGGLLAPASLLAGWLTLALFLIGLGWNLCYVGGSTMLADMLAPAERGSLQGSVELIVNLTSASCNLLSGVILDHFGYTTLGVAGAALALVPLLLVGLHWLRPARRARVA